ncbi:helix-turn-helix domain-containing protein [Mesorhizobium sp. URHB0026]
MFFACSERTMRNARPKFTESTVIVRTVAQMRADKRIESERIRREQARAWVARMEERHRSEMERQAAENAVPYCPPEEFPVPERKIPAFGIITNVAAVHGIPVAAILSGRRDRQAVEARFDAIVAVRNEHPHLSLTQLGRVFKRDHTSILHALQVMAKKAGGIAA